MFLDSPLLCRLLVNLYRRSDRYKNNLIIGTSDIVLVVVCGVGIKVV
jgi:hypothetical protein